MTDEFHRHKRDRFTGTPLIDPLINLPCPPSKPEVDATLDASVAFLLE
jgi:hypothetical protein